MEDGPEDAEGTYRWRDRSYRLEELESEQWCVYDGDTYLGVVIQTDATSAEPWMHYAAHLAGDESTIVPTTDDWHAALRHLIDAANE